MIQTWNSVVRFQFGFDNCHLGCFDIDKTQREGQDAIRSQPNCSLLQPAVGRGHQAFLSRTRPGGLLAKVVMTVHLAVCLTAPDLLGAQAPSTGTCSLATCGLRVEGRVLLWGTPGGVVGRPQLWYDAPLPIQLLRSDSSRALALRYNREGRRAQSLTALGGLLVLGGIAVAAGHDGDWGDLTLVNRGDRVGVFGTRVAVAGVFVSYLGNRMWWQALLWRDRAIWEHNRSVAEGVH